MVEKNKVRPFLIVLFIIGYIRICLYHPAPLLPGGGDYWQRLFIHYFILIHPLFANDPYLVPHLLPFDEEPNAFR